MHIFRIRGKVAAILSFFSLVVVLAACGSNPSTSGASTTSSAAATATACAQVRARVGGTGRVTAGTLQSINGDTLMIATQQGSDVTVTYSSSTRFARQSVIPTTSLKEGTFVTVAGSNANNTFTATRITVTTSTTSNGGFPRFSGTPGTGRFSGSSPCFSRGQFGTPGTGTGQPGNNSNFRGLIGTVSQVSSSSLTLTDTAGAAYSVTITPQTQITQTSSVTAAALKTGMALTVTGTKGSNGAINARAITILLKLSGTRPASTS